MKRMPLNKKAEEGPISIFWFLLWILAMGGILFSVFLFRTYVPDTRPTEAEFLEDHLIKCFIHNGELQHISDIEKDCNLNLKVEGKYEYYLLIDLYNKESCKFGICTVKDPQLHIEVGDKLLPPLCGAEGKVPYCLQTFTYTTKKDTSNENQPYFLGITIAINKLDQNKKK